MYLATGADPTTDTASTPGCARSRSTASFAPWTSWPTPSGNPAPTSLHEGLSVLERDDRGELLQMLLEDGLEAEQDLSPVGDGHLAPGDLGPACGGDGGGDLSRAGGRPPPAGLPRR